MPNAISSYAVPGDRNLPLTGEVIDPRIADVEALARWFDYAFVLPGGFRYGMAGIIGLIPGIGDVIDALVSLYIVYRAVQLGVPRVTIARMMLNVGIEAMAGAVPLIGDLFDVAFKANRRNYELLRSHLAEPRRQRRMDWLFVLGAVLLAILSIALPLWGLAVLLRAFSS